MILETEFYSGLSIQFNSQTILDTLLNGKPGGVRVALTATDLYPDNSWSFVFGQASYDHKAAVASFARFGDTAQEYKLVLRRLIKTASHEASHALGVAHCVAHACLMNGSMSLHEADSRPLSLCPSCMAKVLHASSCDARDRLRKLHSFFQRHGLYFEAEQTKLRLLALES